MSEKEKKTEETIEKVDEHKKIKDSTQEGASMSEFEGSVHAQHEEPTTSSEKVEESTSTSEQIKYKGIARPKRRKPFKVPRSPPLPCPYSYHRSHPSQARFKKKYSDDDIKLHEQQMKKESTSYTSETSSSDDD